MVSKLKKRLTITLATGVSLILIMISFFVIFIFYSQNASAVYSDMATVLDRISEETIADVIPEKLPENNDEAPLEEPDIDFGTNSAVFVASFDTTVKGSLSFPFGLSDKTRTESSADILSQDALAVADGGDEKGIIGFTFYAKKAYEGGTLVLFSSDESFIAKVRILVSTTVAILAVGILFSFWVARMLSEWLTKPVQETLDNQTSFISDVSHELKTPLAVITANADAIETDTGESKWLTSIKNEALRMAGLISELLTASRLERSDDAKTFTKTDLSSIVNETVMTFDALAFEKKALIDTDIADNVTVIGSKEKLRRLVGILLDNAVKYVNEGGSINVKLTQRLGTAYLTVRNTGSFVEKEYRKKIFDRFFRVDESRAKNENFGSYGLGLSIARSIVEEHNGNIVCQSAHGDPDVTTFRVSI